MVPRSSCSRSDEVKFGFGWFNGPMSDTEGSARPRQLTMAGWVVIGGSIFLVLSVFDTVTSLNSVDMREEISRVLSSSTGSGLGITVSEATTVMRVGLMTAAACGAAAAVLGFFVLQRHRAARVVLSVLALPILLTAPLTGGLVGALVAAATLMMWSGPARDWFAGRPVRQVQPPVKRQPPGPWESTMPPSKGTGTDEHAGAVPPRAAPEVPPDGSAGDVPPPSSLSTSTWSDAPVATTGFGERPAAVDDQHQTRWRPPSSAAAAHGPVPTTVKVACTLTWVFSGVVALLYAAMLVVLVAANDRIVDYVVKTPEWQRANFEQSMIVPVLWVGCLLFLGWALGACVLAWFTWRRHNWARWMLAMSAGTALIAAFFALPIGVLHQIAAALTIAGLFSAPARAWFANQPGTPNPPSGPPSGQGHDHDHDRDHDGARVPVPPSGQWPPPDPSQYPQPGPDGQAPPRGGKPPVW
jgi:hypothetical protein